MANIKVETALGGRRETEGNKLRYLFMILLVRIKYANIY
jgi:hypothetical protein